MKDFVAASKQKGLEVYIDPWGVGRVFGGEASSDFVADWPGECQILSSGKRVAVACPNRSSFQDFMHEWVDRACSLGGDVIFWDEPHYYFRLSLALKDPSNYQEWGCCCDVCQEKFKKIFGHSMGQTLTQELIQFREDSLLNLLRMLCKLVHEHGQRNAVCLLPSPMARFSEILGIVDWRKVATIEDVDILSTDPYATLLNIPVEDFVDKNARNIVRLAREFHKESEVWIQGFKIPEGKEGEVIQAIQKAGEESPSRIAVWSYQATACMSELACDNPGLVWSYIKEGLKRF